MRTCVRVSIKGHPYRWFRAALERRDLLGVRSAAAELGRVSLTDALSIVVLMAERDDRALDRAAARWLGRLLLERPSVTLSEARLALTALETVAHDLDSARERLIDVCARHGLNDVVGLSRQPPPTRAADRRR
jgi:hypothetical protein